MKKKTTVEQQLDTLEIKLDTIDWKLDNIRPRFKLRIEARQVLVICTVILTGLAVWWTVFDIYFRR